MFSDVKRKINLPLQTYQSGYTLLYAVLIVIIVCCVSILLLSYFRISDLYMNRATAQSKALQYGYNGLSWLTGEQVPYNHSYAFSYEDGFTIRLEKKRWGGYDLLLALVIKGSEDTLFRKQLLTGMGYDTLNRTTLYVQDTRQYVYLNDSVSITGDCFVPYGILKMRGASAPPPATRIHPSSDSIFTLKDADGLAEWIQPLPSAFPKNKIISEGTATHSFTDSPEWIAADTVIFKGTLTGNYIVKAHTIIVQKEAKLKHILLHASIIIFNGSSNNAVQAFATDSIICGTHSDFAYPSLLMILPPPVSAYRRKQIIPTIFMEDSVRYTGDLIAMRGEGLNDKQPFIRTGSDCDFMGGIYCTGSVQLNGTYNGVVICSKLYTAINGNIQSNELYHTRLDIDAFPSFYTFSRLFPANNHSKTVAWVP